MELFKPESPNSGTPEALLAQDEALLEYCEATEHAGFLTFWESRTYFVVLGYSKVLSKEVIELQCERLRIPILRRCSGGGTVLQGRGCLNYTLVVPISATPELETITGANRYLMERIRAAVAPLAGEIEIRGYTDLTLNGLKFSGNAQRRKRRCLLFHGTFLLNFDLALISETLRLPLQQPDYRQNRAHETFLTNLNVDRTKIELALIEAWNAKQTSSAEVQREISLKTAGLAASKYSTDEWNRRA